MDIESRVIKIVALEMGMREAEITADSTLDSLVADSLNEVQIIMMIEEEFAVEIPDADAEKMTSIKDVVDYLGRPEG